MKGKYFNIKKYGLKAAREAFGISKSTVYIFGSSFKSPKNPRKKEWHPEIVEYIKKRKEECSRIGQETLKKELEKFCKEKRLKLPSSRP